MDHPNLAGAAVTVSHVPATPRSCRAVRDPGCAAPCSTAVCPSLAEEAAPKFSSSALQGNKLSHLSSCEQSFVPVFAPCKTWQGERALLTAKGRGGCERDWETRTFSERSSPGEEEKFLKCVGLRGIQAGAVGPKPREDGVSLQEMFWGSFEADRFMGIFLLQLNWV